MTHVFVSYARDDKDLCLRVVAALRASGVEVWWDDNITPEGPWDRQIEAAIENAGAVLVLWTPRSIERDIVRSEAYRGNDARKLVQLRMESCSLPIGLDRFQAQDLADWDGSPHDPRWIRVVSWITSLLAHSKTVLAPINPAPSAEPSENPQARIIQRSVEALDKIAAFLAEADRPLPLRRHLENQRALLSRDAEFLSRLTHNVAFIGDWGVGKSSAINCVFELLTPKKEGEGIAHGVLARGTGGTTLCEVHIREGDQYGVRIKPMDADEVRQTIDDCCRGSWLASGRDAAMTGQPVGVAQEVERALRNMAGLSKKKGPDGEAIDPLAELARSCASEQELQERVCEKLKLEDRNVSEIHWEGSGVEGAAIPWLRKTFRYVNYGLLPGMTLPKEIELRVPGFARNEHGLKLTVIDTKGVDKIAVRNDLDQRLRDARTAVVLCAEYRTAPGTTVLLLLSHATKTFAEELDTGKVSILVLPKSDEALSTVDDAGEPVATKEAGYAVKRDQVVSELAQGGYAGIPIGFFNAVSDDPQKAQQFLVSAILRQRNHADERLTRTLSAVDEAIENQAEAAFKAAITEVARRLNAFLNANRLLTVRRSQFHALAAETVRTANAQTVWAATRRNGRYGGLNIVHLLGVGAAQDAGGRSERWANSLADFLNALRSEKDLALAGKAIEQVANRAELLTREFLDAVRKDTSDVYAKRLDDDELWGRCTSEYGTGAAGYKDRVAGHLEGWFAEWRDLSEALDRRIEVGWEQGVIAPLVRLSERDSSAWEAQDGPQDARS